MDGRTPVGLQVQDWHASLVRRLEVYQCLCSKDHETALVRAGLRQWLWTFHPASLWRELPLWILAQQWSQGGVDTMGTAGSTLAAVLGPVLWDSVSTVASTALSDWAVVERCVHTHLADSGHFRRALVAACPLADNEVQQVPRHFACTPHQHPLHSLCTQAHCDECALWMHSV